MFRVQGWCVLGATNDHTTPRDKNATTTLALESFHRAVFDLMTLVPGRGPRIKCQASTYPGGTKKYAKPPTREVADKPIAPTNRRFITLRLPMSGTSPDTAAATTLRFTDLATAAGLRPRDLALHPSFAEKICVEAAVARAAIFANRGVADGVRAGMRGRGPDPGGGSGRNRETDEVPQNSEADAKTSKR